MKLFFSLFLFLFLLLSLQARDVIIFDYLQNQEEGVKFSKKYIEETFGFPEKFIRYRLVETCPQGDQSSALHLCFDKDIKILFMNSSAMNKLIDGYTN